MTLESGGFSIVEPWLPVGRFMPEDGELVLGTITAHGSTWVDLVRHYRGYWQTQFGVAVNVVAWAHLPDPPDLQ